MRVIGGLGVITEGAINSPIGTRKFFKLVVHQITLCDLKAKKMSESEICQSLLICLLGRAN